MELVVAVIFLLFVFILVYLEFGNKNVHTELIKEELSKETECERIASIINLIEKAEENAEITLLVEYDFNAGRGEVTIGDFYCDLRADVNETQLQKGYVAIKKESGEVSVENI